MTKETTEAVFLRLPASLVAKLKAKAESDERTINKTAERILGKALRWKGAK